MVLTVFKA